MNETIKEITSEHNGKEHVRGTRDCNLMFFRLYEPAMFDAIHKQYDDILGGVKAGKRLFGFRSLRSFLQKNKYKEVQPNFQMHGDIVTFHKGHDVYISLGNKWFGVRENNTFGVINRYDFDTNAYLVFRKE